MLGAIVSALASMQDGEPGETVVRSPRSHALAGFDAPGIGLVVGARFSR